MTVANMSNLISLDSTDEDASPKEKQSSAKVQSTLPANFFTAAGGGATSSTINPAKVNNGRASMPVQSVGQKVQVQSKSGSQPPLGNRNDEIESSDDEETDDGGFQFDDIPGPVRKAFPQQQQQQQQQNFSFKPSAQQSAGAVPAALQGSAAASRPARNLSQPRDSFGFGQSGFGQSGNGSAAASSSAAPPMQQQPFIQEQPAQQTKFVQQQPNLNEKLQQQQPAAQVANPFGAVAGLFGRPNTIPAPAQGYAPPLQAPRVGGNSVTNNTSRQFPASFERGNSNESVGASSAAGMMGVGGVAGKARAKTKAKAKKQAGAKKLAKVKGKRRRRKGKGGGKGRRGSKSRRAGLGPALLPENEGGEDEWPFEDDDEYEGDDSDGVEIIDSADPSPTFASSSASTSAFMPQVSVSASASASSSTLPPSVAYEPSRASVNGVVSDDPLKAQRAAQQKQEEHNVMQQIQSMDVIIQETEGQIQDLQAQLRERREEKKRLNSRLKQLRATPNDHWSKGDFPWTRQLVNACKAYFNVTQFRGNQLEAMNAVLGGRDVMLVMPTGAGKSLCSRR